MGDDPLQLVPIGKELRLFRRQGRRDLCFEPLVWTGGQAMGQIVEAGKAFAAADRGQTGLYQIGLGRRQVLARMVVGECRNLLEGRVLHRASSCLCPRKP